MKAQKKTKLFLVIAIIIIAIASTGCERTYEAIDENLATPEVAGDGFSTPLPEVDGMEGLLELGAQTLEAQTLTAEAGGADADAPAEAETEDAQPADTEATETPETAATVTPPVIATTVVDPAALVGKPASYTLKKGEFPYCIARRFNVDPKELLSLNSISSAQAQTYQPGLTLSIPQSAAAFPPPRARHAHPISYTVPSNTTVYGVACFFGDIDPATITSANTIPDINNIAAGTVLQIP